MLPHARRKAVIAPPPEEAPNTVISLMDALQKSVAAAKKPASPKAVRRARHCREGQQQRKRKTW